MPLSLLILLRPKILSLPLTFNLMLTKDKALQYVTVIITLIIKGITKPLML